MYFLKKRRGGFFEAYTCCVFPNSDDANPPIHILYNYTYIPELRVTTAEFDCTHLFVIFSPLHDGLYVTVQHAVQSRTHTRYGSQFVSSPSSSLLSALSKECRVLFIQTIQSCVRIYIYILYTYVFFSLFSFILIYSYFSFFVWACCSD